MISIVCMRRNDECCKVVTFESIRLNDRYRIDSEVNSAGRIVEFHIVISDLLFHRLVLACTCTWDSV